MKGLQIKINSQWVKLSEDFSITLEQSNPLFNDQGIFSFPFEIPLEPNREIFKNIADPWGDINLKDIDRMPAELWVDGIMIYRGVIETDDEVEFEDTLPVTFISGNSDFMDRIEGMNARDIPLDREIKLGYRVESAGVTYQNQNNNMFITIYLGDGIMNYTESNESDPYPIKPYCNARVCTPNDAGNYNILEPRRPYSGVCFYVMYILDCFFKYLNIAVQKNDLSTMEDMCRLAFFSTQCHTEAKGEEFSVSWNDIMMNNFMGSSFSLHYDLKYQKIPGLNSYRTIATFLTQNFSYKARNVYATNENIPDVSMEDLIDDLQNAFGVRFLYDSAKNTMDVIYIKDILKSNEISILDVEIVGMQLKKSKEKTIRLTYGQEDDTTFNYDNYSNVKEKNNYLEILQQGQASNDTTCYQDKLTGNSYRIKVDKNTGGNPSLFEVGGFRDYLIGGTSTEEDEDEISINFSPVMINDVNGSTVVEEAFSGKQGEQILAVFADQELLSERKVEKSLIPFITGFLDYSKMLRYKHEITLSYLSDENYDTESAEESPMRTYDAGYCLGIMRGPGSESGIDYTENYDGEGNDSWVQTVANSAFTADSCDNFGRFFDYNGTEQGGVDQSGRFSLKLVAGKDKYPASQAYQDRGLVSKFLSEYLYFLYNRKTVILTVRMTISQIAGLDMLKRYQIGNYVGFINKLSYSIDRSGITEVTIELYTI